MKRSALPPRKTSLKARTGLKAGAPLRARKALASSTKPSPARTGGLLGPHTGRLEPVSASRRAARDRDEEWRWAVWAKDLGVCQAGPGGSRERRVCEVDCEGGLDAHHVAPKGQYPSRRYDVDNGVVLCRAHHDWVHSHTPEARARGLFR